MHILIYGAGAIGGYLGARLLHSGEQVTMLDRPDMADAINGRGITLQEGPSTIQVYPPAVPSLSAALARQPYDLILMGLKSYDLPAALEVLAGHDLSGAAILTVQNGIGIEYPFVKVFGSEKIIAGSLTTPVSKKGALHLVVERSDRGLALAPTASGLPIDRWVELFQAAGVRTIALDNYEAMKWSKAFLNIVSNATSAILAMPPAEVYGQDELFDLEVAMLRETVAVMEALRLPVVNLPGSAARSLALAVRFAPRFLLKPGLTRIVAGGRGDKMPSFYIDLVSGRGKSEVIYHNGAIAETGRSLGIPTPVNATLNDVLLRLTHRELERAEFAGSPARLLAELPGW